MLCFNTLSKRNHANNSCRDDFTKQLEALVKAIRPDDQDFTTIEHIRDGLAGTGHGGSKLDRDGIHETEWVRGDSADVSRERPTQACTKNHPISQGRPPPAPSRGGRGGIYLPGRQKKVLRWEVVRACPPCPA